MVLRVSVPFPLVLFGRGKAKYGTGRKKPLTCRVCLPIIHPGMRNKTLDYIFSSLVSKRRMATFLLVFSI